MFWKPFLIAWMQQPFLFETPSYHLWIGNMMDWKRNKPNSVNVIIGSISSKIPKSSSDLFLKETQIPQFLPESFDTIYIDHPFFMRKYHDVLIHSLKKNGKLIVVDYDDSLMEEIWSFPLEMKQQYFPNHEDFFQSQFVVMKKWKNMVIYSTKTNAGKR